MILNTTVRTNVSISQILNFPIFYIKKNPCHTTIDAIFWWNLQNSLTILWIPGSHYRALTGWPKKGVNIWPLLQWNKGQILTLFLGHPILSPIEPKIWYILWKKCHRGQEKMRESIFLVWYKANSCTVENIDFFLAKFNNLWKMALYWFLFGFSLTWRNLWTLPGRKQCMRSSSFPITITTPNFELISSTVEEFWARYHQNAKIWVLRENSNGS